MPVRVRRLRPDERDAFAALIDRAAERGDLAGSAATHHDWIARHAVLRPLEFAVAEDETGLVGFVSPEIKALVVEPVRRRQGIGARLVEAGLAIERERDRPDLILGTLPGDVRATSFLAATGFAYHSTVWDLELPPECDAARPELPDWVVVRPFRRDRDLAEWVALFNAAFADHPTPLQLDLDQLRAAPADDTVRDDDTILLEDSDGRLAGFSATEPRYLPDGAVKDSAEIWAIGVRPDLQGRGLGRLLLRLGIARLRAHHVETITLAVNGRNPHALALYESEGFERVATRDRWVRPVVARGT